MANELQAAKAVLRNQIRILLGGISPAMRAALSSQVCARLAAEPIWKNARTILFFAPAPEEVGVWPLLESALAAGRTVALPRFSVATQSYVAARVRDLAADLTRGKFNLREPSPSCAELPPGLLDLILVPGVAFDVRGQRLGRGKGFYDRLLAEISGVKCGVAFDEQLVERIPDESHDARVDWIVTPTRWIKTEAK